MFPRVRRGSDVLTVLGLRTQTITFSSGWERVDSEKPEGDSLQAVGTACFVFLFYFFPWKSHLLYLSLLFKVAFFWSKRNPACATAEFLRDSVTELGFPDGSDG